MSDIIYTSFTYDPATQGYDTNSWNTLSGTPVAANGRLLVDSGAGIGSAIHLAAFQKGDIRFDVNVPTAPAIAGDCKRYFGVSNGARTKYLRFAINEESFTAQTSDGTTTTESSQLEWGSTWTGVDTDFRIQWEAGQARFFVNGVKVYTVADASVPYGPLRLFLFDESASAMTVGAMDVLCTQSYVMNLISTDTTGYEGIEIGTFQAITISENLTIYPGILLLPVPGNNPPLDSLTVSENIALFNDHRNMEFSESFSVSEDITLTVVDP